LVAAPKPVICLDTCDILEVVQCLDWERPSAARNTACVTAAQRLLTTLTADPDAPARVRTEELAGTSGWYRINAAFVGAAHPLRAQDREIAIRSTKKAMEPPRLSRREPPDLSVGRSRAPVDQSDGNLVHSNPLEPAFGNVDVALEA
jgi:hypothetical protein